MKTKLKYFSLAIAALLMVGFASCSSDDEPTVGVGENETISVMLKLDLGVTTRAEVPALTGGKATLATADVYFTTAQGAITGYCTIGKTISGVPTFTGNTVTMENLPGNTANVYVFGNSPEGLPVSGPISVVKARTIALASQTNIGNINLYGFTDEFGTSTGVAPVSGNAQYSVAVTVKPTVSRIELAQLTSDPLKNLTEFTVDGIFVDNYYQTATVEGTVSALKPIFLDANKYAATAEGPYKSGAEGMNYDLPALAAVSKVAKPADPNVWGYNLFAQTSVSVVPRIVIKLSNVQAPGVAAFDGPQYLTIKGFKDSTGNTTLTTIDPGKIYKIQNVIFCSKDLAPAPNMGDRDVTVTVTVVDWTVENVIADI